MDISEKMDELFEKNKENDIIPKQTMELISKKYELQNSVKELETTLSIKQDEFDKIKSRVVSLSCELPGCQEKARVSEISLKKLIKEVVKHEEKTHKIQSDLWHNINNWVDKTSQYFQTLTCQQKNMKSLKVINRERDKKLEHLKIEGELEALQAFEKFQYNKIKEIETIRNLVMNIDQVPFNSQE